jgi:serine/threonine protein kinase
MFQSCLDPNQPLTVFIRNAEGKEFVAIKILKASDFNTELESTVYSKLSKADRLSDDIATTPSRSESPLWTQFIVPLLSSFTHIGPNGYHVCLVFQPMGCSVSELLGERASLACLRDRSISKFVDRGFNTRQAKSVLRQILNGLVILHSNGLIHGDLHLGNALFPLRAKQFPLRAGQANFNRKPGIFMPQDSEDENIAEKVRRRDGQDIDKHAPRYLVTHESLIPYSALEDDQLGVKLIDVKGQAPEEGLHNKTPLSVQSPELALEDEASQSQDIWAFGCAIFEVLTGFCLFRVYTLGTTRQTQVDELMLRFSETLGPLSPAIIAKWKRYSQYFDEHGERNEREPNDQMLEDTENEGNEKQIAYDSDTASEESTEFKHVDEATLAEDIEAYFATPSRPKETLDDISPILEHLFDRFKPSDMGTEEGDRVKVLLRRIFQYDPEKRPQACDLQKDSWLASPKNESSGMSELNRDSPQHGDGKGKRKR